MGQQPEALRCEVPRAVGLPWLQTQLQSYEQGLFLVQSCSFAKIKVQEQFQALVSRCWRQKPGGVVAGPWEKGRAWGTPNDVSNRNFSSWGDGSVLPNADPTTTHVWGEEVLQALGGSRGNHPCELCGCLLSAGPSVSITHIKIRHNSCIYKQ